MLTTLAQISAIDPYVWFWIILALVCIVWSALKYSAEVLKTRQIQQTKREIAAYVAEGSISPEDAVRMLESESNDLERKIVADAAAWGTISPEKAVSIIKSIRDETGNTAKPVSKD